MNLREEFNQAILEKNAQAKLEETIQIGDRLLPQEVQNMYALSRGKTGRNRNVPLAASNTASTGIPQAD